MNRADFLRRVAAVALTPLGIKLAAAVETPCPKVSDPETEADLALLRSALPDPAVSPFKAPPGYRVKEWIPALDGHQHRVELMTWSADYANDVEIGMIVSTNTAGTETGVVASKVVNHDGSVTFRVHHGPTTP